jgi:hypothetical protein
MYPAFHSASTGRMRQWHVGLKAMQDTTAFVCEMCGHTHMTATWGNIQVQKFVQKLCAALREGTLLNGKVADLSKPLQKEVVAKCDCERGKAGETKLLSREWSRWRSRTANPISGWLIRPAVPSG